MTRCRWEARSAADLGFASDSLNMKRPSVIIMVLADSSIVDYR